MNVIITESQARRLLVSGGIHPDGQFDLFFNQDEVDRFHTESDEKLRKILLSVEKECGWAHDEVNCRDTASGRLYKCYPMGYFYSHKPVYRHEFVKELTSRMPDGYIETSYPMTAIRPEDWYVDVTIKKV